MFKKIHSNRRPEVTVLSEIKNEFGVYFRRLETAIRSRADRHPELLFRLMIILMAVSLLLSFTVFRFDAPPEK